MDYWPVAPVVVVVDAPFQRIVLATEETTVTQQVSHRPIKCQSRLWSQRGTKVNGSHHGDNPLLRPTGIQIATKSYAALQAMAPTNIKTVHQTSLQLLLLLFLTFSALVANPKKSYFTRWPKKKKKSGSAPPLPPRAARSEKKKITQRIHMSRRYASRRYAGGLGPSRIRTRIPTTRQLGQWVLLRKTLRFRVRLQLSQSRCLSLLLAMSVRVFLFLPPRGHEPPPTLRDRLNPNINLYRHRFPIPRYAKRPDVALYTVGPFTPYREQPRSTRNVVAYPRPAFSVKNRKNYAPTSFDQQVQGSSEVTM